MERVYEVTTITGDAQHYEIIRISPIRFANDKPGISIETLKKDKKAGINHFAAHAHAMYSMTGLDESIKLYPSQLVAKHDGERFTSADIIRPKRLRLIYDAFPLGHGIPILRICPIEGQRIFVKEYDPKQAQLPLEKMTMSPEFDGSMHIQFTGLEVFLKMRNFEEENEEYYGRNLKTSCALR